MSEKKCPKLLGRKSASKDYCLLLLLLFDSILMKYE